MHQGPIGDYRAVWVVVLPPVKPLIVGVFRSDTEAMEHAFHVRDEGNRTLPKTSENVANGVNAGVGNLA